MKPAPSGIEVLSSNLSSTRTGKLALDEDSLAQIMDTLTNIYSDAELAVIREYPSNAWDSHREAGQTRPIEVTLPNHFDSIFKVKDFGVGMDGDEILEKYSKYGLSTKRETNDAIGMLGIGCKSALTYVDQFTLRTVKNGERFTAVISRSEDGGGDVNVSGPYPTDEPNGVEVSVAVLNAESFNRKAYEFFTFWNEDDVRINGAPPPRLSGLWIDDDVVVLDGTQRFTAYNGDLIVMGGVPYPIPRSRYHYGNRAASIVAFVPIGSVEPAPSREALKDTPLTLDTVDTVRAFVRDRLRKIRQDELDACETAPEARKLRASWSLSDGERNELNYRGNPIPTRISVDGFRYEGGFVENYKEDGPRGDTCKLVINNVDRRSLLFITGFTNKSVHVAHRDRLKRLRSDVQLYSGPIVFFVESLSKVTNLSWVEPENIEVIDFEDLRAVQLPKTRRSSTPKTVDPTYEVLTPFSPYTTDYIADAFNTSYSVYYLTPAEEKEYTLDARDVRDLIGDEYTYIVRLQANRVAKFLRRFPKAENAINVIADVASHVRTSLSPMEVTYSSGVFNNWSLKGVDSADVLDPEIKSVLKDIENIDREKVAFWQSINRKSYILKKRCGLTTQMMPTRRTEEEDEARRFLTRIDERYPFLQRVHYSSNAQDLLEYVNALYTYRQEG